MHEETNAGLHTSDHYSCPTLNLYKATNSTKLSKTEIKKKILQATLELMHAEGQI